MPVLRKKKLAEPQKCMCPQIFISMACNRCIGEYLTNQVGYSLNETISLIDQFCADSEINGFELLDISAAYSHDLPVVVASFGPPWVGMDILKGLQAHYLTLEYSTKFLPTLCRTDKISHDVAICLQALLKDFKPLQWILVCILVTKCLSYLRTSPKNVMMKQSENPNFSV